MSSERSASSSSLCRPSSSTHTTSTALSVGFESTKLPSAGRWPGKAGRIGPQSTTPGCTSIRGVKPRPKQASSRGLGLLAILRGRERV
jgi:hypothetical protein